MGRYGEAESRAYFGRHLSLELARPTTGVTNQQPTTTLLASETPTTDGCGTENALQSKGDLDIQSDVEAEDSSMTDAAIDVGDNLAPGAMANSEGSAHKIENQKEVGSKDVSIYPDRSSV
jgi:hypothetical protein